MKGLVLPVFSRSRFITLVVLSACIIFAFVLSACGGNPPVSTGTATAQTTAKATATATTASATPAATAKGYPVKVFFSKNPESFGSNSPAFPVDRISPTIAVATFSLQLLIAGPTLSERQVGYFSEFNSLFGGPSNCSAPLPTGGPDFTLTLDKKGTVPQIGTATVKFCRSTESPGIGADARVTTEITATLKQFANIKKVVILNINGHCFGDLSGMDFCLK